jgi:hypothetical protein
MGRSGSESGAGAPVVAAGEDASLRRPMFTPTPRGKEGSPPLSTAGNSIDAV